MSLLTTIPSTLSLDVVDFEPIWNAPTRLSFIDVLICDLLPTKLSMAFSELNHRNGQAGSKYMVVVPLIGLLNYLANWSSLNEAYVYCNSILVLLSYRCNLNWSVFAFLNLALPFLLQTLFHGKSGSSIHGLTDLILVGIPTNLLIVSSIFNLIYLKLINNLPVKYLRSFTFAEFALVSQSISVYLVKLIQFNLSNHIHFVTDYSEADKFCLSAYTSLVVFICFHSLTNARFVLIAPLLPPLVYLNILKCLQKEPIDWLLHYLFDDCQKVKLFSIWLVVLSMVLLFVVVHTYFSPQTTSTVTRKIFHFAISIVYITGVVYDLEFLRFTSQLVLFAFIIVEITRLSNVPFISPVINQVFERFRDEKDSGVLTLTHIYLLVGCSLPVWIGSPQSKLIALSGVISIGISDTCASIIGFYFGRHKLLDSSKTIEGTLSFMISHLLAMNMLAAHLHETTSFSGFVLISAICSLFEALTMHIDNLLLPFVDYILCIILIRIF